MHENTNSTSYQKICGLLLIKEKKIIHYCLLSSLQIYLSFFNSSQLDFVLQSWHNILEPYHRL